LLGIALGAMKLAPSIAFVWTFPRPDPLVLIGFTALAAALFYGYFLPFAVLPALRPELDFGIGPVPLYVFLMPLFFRARWQLLRRHIRYLAPKHTIPLCVLLLVPIVINYDGPGFQPFLQKLPYIGNNVILTRWWFVYITFLIPACAVLFDAMVPSQRERNVVASCGMLVTALYSIGVDHSYYLQQRYDPTEITQANDRSSRGEPVPPISAIADDTNGLASGNSRFPCYEPMFGYHLQTFPAVLDRKTLAGGARLVNPSCYVYGNANGCSPGDKFPIGSDAQAEFAAYRPFPYVVPIWQKCADIVTLIALGLCVAFVMTGLVAAAQRWRLQY
jgi:hypothetical protein